jgi:hypothetical protein
VAKEREEAEILYQGPGYTIVCDSTAGTLVPYFYAERPDGNINYGFFDLRDNPAAVDAIPEADKVPGLAKFLRAVASLMTSACEAHVFDRGADHDPPEQRFQGGSYVVIEYRDLDKCRDPDRYVKLAGYVLHGVAPTDGHIVGYEFVIEPLKTFFGHDGCFALEAKGIGMGASEDEAWAALDYAMGTMADSISRPPSQPENGDGRRPVVAEPKPDSADGGEPSD